METTFLSDDFLKKLQYVVIYNGMDMSTEAEKNYKKLQSYWEKSWTSLYKQLNSSETLNPNDFTMQDKITALTYNDQIVGMHLLKNYSKKDFSQHPYFTPYDSQFFSELEKNKVQQLQSFQYFWVDPEWSRKITGVNFAAIIASLSLKFQTSENLDASITIARKDIKVHETAEKIGFSELAPSTSMHNVSVALMACFKPQLYPDLRVNQWADYYWKNKMEYKIQKPKTGVAA